MSRNLNYANVTATLAIFIALGGGAWAVNKASIGSSDLKDDAVKSKHIKDGQVKGPDIKDDAVDGDAVDEGSLDQVPDARELDGRRFVHGEGDPTATTPEVLAVLPGLNAQIETDGNADEGFEIALRNSRSAGGGNVAIACEDSLAVALPGAATTVNLGSRFHAVCTAYDFADADARGRALVFCDLQTGSVDAIRCDVLRD